MFDFFLIWGGRSYGSSKTSATLSSCNRNGWPKFGELAEVTVYQRLRACYKFFQIFHDEGIKRKN